MAKVLIVEDNQTLGNVLKEALSEHEVITALNGHEGLGILIEAYESDRPFDLLVLDYKVPGINGPSLSRKVREIESKKIVPRAVIVITSGHAGEIDEEKVLRESGADHYIGKPFYAETIANLLK